MRRRAIAACLIALGATGAGAADAPVYAALGDGIAAGAFATVAVAPHRLTAYAAGEPRGTAYATLIARRIGATRGVRYQNLAVPDAGVFAVWNEQVPAVDPRATVVTLSFGLSDEVAIALRRPVRVDGRSAVETPEFWRVGLRRIVDDLRAAAPNARIVLANVPNAARFAGLDADATTRSALSAAADAMNAAVAELDGGNVAVVDLRDDAAIYARGALAAGTYPNDRGQALLARRFLAALK